jgi:hypothetical protein
MTARQAFYRNRSALMNLVGQMTEPEKFTAVLAELGIGVKLRDKKPELAPVTPVDVARVYSACADLGKIHEVSPAWRRTGESPEKNPVRAMTQTKPAVLFLMNRLLLDADPKAGPKIRKPSVFSAVDESGAWVVAYRGDCLLVVRARTSHIKDLAQPKLIERFFRDLPGEHEEPPPPEGVVFRWMCVQSGLRAGSVCPKVIQEPFLKGTQPEEWCHFRHDPEVKRTDMRGR